MSLSATSLDSLWISTDREQCLENLGGGGLRRHLRDSPRTPATRSTRIALSKTYDGHHAAPGAREPAAGTRTPTRTSELDVESFGPRASLVLVLARWNS